MAPKTGDAALQARQSGVSNNLWRHGVLDLPSSSGRLLNIMVHDLVAPRQCCNIRVRSPLGIVVALPLCPVLLQIGRNGAILPVRSRPILREAAAGHVGCNFWTVSLGTTDRGNIWACCWKAREKFSFAFAIIGQARRSRAKIACSDDDRDSTGTQLTEHVADLLAIAFGDVLLIYLDVVLA